MKKCNWFYSLLAGLLCLSAQAAERVWELKSPDGKLEVKVWTDGQLSYALHRDGQVLVDKSPVGLVFSDGVLGENAKVGKAKRRSEVKEHIVSPHYRVPAFDVVFNELDLKLKGGHGVLFRAYDEGIAYRFYTTSRDSLVVEQEIATMNFDRDYLSYRAYSTKPKDPYCMAFQNLYTKAALTEADTANLAFLPVTVDYGNGVKATLLESDLEHYPGMFVRGGGCALQGVFAPYPVEFKSFPPRAMKRVTKRAEYIAKVEGTRTFPWRIWAVTTDDREMPLNNLVYALAAPNRIGDGTWIKTGKVAWEWWNDWGLFGVDFQAGINMDTYKHYIDFAAENRLEFVVLDEGWYDPKSGDMLTVIPELDLEELVRYGKSKGVDLILWTVFNVLDDQLEAACQKYSKMGISGFKVDFLDRDDQTAVEMAYRIAETTAKYHLTLDLHGFYKPTGLNRTYPNIINYESVFGMEEMKWSTVEKDMMAYDVTMPFIRMMAGPVDYTPGAMRNASKADFKPIYKNPLSQGTRCHQLATYIVHDSPLTMLADNPSIYRQEQECTDFIARIPNDGFDETRILQGRLGEFIVTARKVGNAWYVGGLTDWSPREITLDFSFLGKGTYEATLFQDGVNADEQAADYRKEVFRVDSSTRRSVRMASGGGFALVLRRL